MFPVQAERHAQGNDKYNINELQWERQYTLIDRMLVDFFGTGEKQAVSLYAHKIHPDKYFADSWIIKVDGKELFKAGDSDGLYREGELIFREELGRPEIKQLLLFRYSIGSGGAQGLDMFLPLNGQLRHVFVDPNPVNKDAFTKRFKVKYAGEYVVNFIDNKYGINVDVKLDEKYYKGMADVENKLQNIGTWIDPISEYTFKDLDGDGIAEITAIQYLFGLGHWDMIATIKTIYKYSQTETKYRVSYVALYDSKNLLITKRIL